MANSSNARGRAEVQFDKTQKPKEVRAKVLSEYEMRDRAVREKTARLKSIRVAKEAAERGAQAKGNPDARVDQDWSDQPPLPK